MIKKKATKKAEKKAAPPKQKLIEGQYSHKFLTRLRPEVGQRLDALMKSTNNKTFNGAIVHLIDTFEIGRKLHQDTERQLREAKQQMNTQANLLMSLKSNFKSLQDLKLVDLAINSDCPECGGEIVNGECEDCGHEM
jgi:hypothetical protein